MRRPAWVRALPLALGAILLAICFLRYALSPSVPSHQGRGVYYWMMQTRSSDLADNPGLSAIGSNAVPYLARALSTTNTPFDRSVWIRHPAAQSILRRLSHDPGWTQSSQEIRRAASFSLLAFSFEARPALPQLLAELVNPRAGDRQTVLFCLGEMGVPEEAIPTLVRAWPLATNDVWVVRHTLIHALGRAGPAAAEPALPIVLAALDDPEAEVRVAAANALDRWGQPVPAAVPRLTPLLSGTDLSLATAAAGALGRVTHRAEAALPALRGMLECTNALARATAAITLWRLGGDAAETRRTLESLLENKEGRGAAASFLGGMGEAAKESVPALLRASRVDLGAWVDMYDRAQCARAVLRIQGDSPEARQVLEQALSFKPNPWVRMITAGQLGELAAAATPLIPALARAREDPDREVRHAARQALARLESGAAPRSDEAPPAR